MENTQKKNIPVERLTRRLDHMVPEPRMLATIPSLEDAETKVQSESGK